MADVKPSFFEVPCVAIITGASRGIGRAIALKFGKRFEDTLHLVLTGRSEKDLQETVSLIKCIDNCSPDKTTVTLVPGDLGDQEDFPSLVERLFGDIDDTKYRHAILVSNAATTGDITKLARDFSHSDSSEIQDFFFMNVTTTLLLASKFLSTFPSCDPRNGSEAHTRRRTIVQISSVAAVRATPSWSMYCTAKAARDMLHKVIAAEEPDVRVLSYAPGAVDTVMFRYAKDHSASPATTKWIADVYKKIVIPEKTAGVLCDELNKDTYESGAHVSFFDLID